MQRTLFILYMFQYIYFSLQLLLICLLWIPYICYSRATFTIFLTYIKLYTPLTGLILFIFLNLAGLPPVFSFFIKLNFLGYMFHHYTGLIDVIIFSIFFFSIVFYIQPLKYKVFVLSWTSHFKFENLQYSVKNIYYYPTTKYFFYFFYFFQEIYQKPKYTFLFFICFINCLLLNSFFFFLDFYVIIYNLCGF